MVNYYYLTTNYKFILDYLKCGYDLIKYDGIIVSNEFAVYL